MKLFYDRVFKNYFLIMLTLFVEEIIFRAVVDLPILEWSLLRTFIGINIISLIFSALFSFFGRIASNVLSAILTLAFTVYAIAQAGFENYLGVFMSFGTSSQADAVKEFIGEYVESFSWSFWLIAIPFVFMLLFYIFVDHRIKVLERNDQIDFADKFDSEERKQLNDKLLAKAHKKKNINSKINALVVAIILIVVYYFSLTLSFMQNELQAKSTRDLFRSPDIPNVAMSQFGFSMYAFVDIKSLILPSNSLEDSSYDEGYEIKEQSVSDYIRYINDDVWEEITKDETDSNYKRLNNYYISQKITDKNDYTGLFKDKNLIVIMMESTNNIVINEEYFPNFYKLYTEGWAWDNAYSPRNSCSTANNEISGMMSLFTINNSCTANKYKNNTYSEAIFNLFNRAGYTTSSYHNYTEKYYARSVIHPNMGSGHYYGVQELGIPYNNAYEEWPSDDTLIQKFLEKIEDQDKFMAWITTVSAHQPYTKSSELGDKYLDLFNDTNYNISLKRYLSKLKEFDKAIGTLLDGLEDQGKLDDTVIVLYADHYPYGLTNSTINSYLDYDVNVQREIDRTPFVIYNSAMQNQKFKEYTSFINLTPTLANLFDLDYDPRLYAGEDILSEDYENRVIFADGSWKDEKAFYNSTTGKITYVDKNDTYTTEEIKQINKTINDKISMSNLAIKTNYFDYLAKAKEEHKVESLDDETNNKEDNNE